MPRLIRLGLWCLSLALIMGAGARAADTPADNPLAVKAAAPEKGDARPESSAVRPPSERPPVRMPIEGAPRSMRGFGGAPPAPPTDVLTARFEATVYEVQVPVDRAGKLDAAALSAKASIVQVASVNHSEALQYGRPQVMLNVTYPQKSDKDSAYACVIRYAFSEVKP